MPKTFVTCAIIIDDQDRYLLIKRARDPYAGYWACISGIGASRKGFPPEQAVINEVKHDIRAEFQGHLAFSYPLPESRLASTAYVFIGQVNQSQIALNPRAATDYRWFSHHELEQEASLAFEDKWILEQITTS